jgi:GDP-L-fucose synthase
MDKFSKIYIAGHRGMVGSSLLRMLNGRGYNNIITRTHAELDLTRQGDVEAFFEREKPEFMISANVINSAYKFGATKLLNLGSSCIYPKFAQQPMKEEFILTGNLEPTNEPYAIAKISALKLCRYYNDQYGTNYISVMPTNLYGPHDNFNLETGHVVGALIRKFWLATLLRNNDLEGIRNDIKNNRLGFGLDKEIAHGNGSTTKTVLKKIGITEDYVLLWGSGEAYREFLHVDDLADACIYLMLNGNYKELGEIVNVGTGEDIKIKDFAALVGGAGGFSGEIRYDLSRPDGTPKKLLDVSKMTEIGWKAKIGIKEGIKQTYDWYRKNNNIGFKRFYN